MQSALIFLRRKSNDKRVEEWYFVSDDKNDWFSNVKGDVLSGVVVALALIPEAIAFSVIAGVDPTVGLYAAFCIAVTISFVGGRTGMISAATGAMALLMVTLVKDHGLQYLFATTILTGIVQIIFGVFKLSSFMKFVPKSVMSGFLNALGILVLQHNCHSLKMQLGKCTRLSH